MSKRRLQTEPKTALEKTKTHLPVKETFGTITVIDCDNGEDRPFPLSSTRCLIGSGDDCDIIVRKPGVSQQTCQIEINKERQAFLVNLSQRSQTLINGVTLASKSALKYNDLITIAGRRLRYDAHHPAISHPRRKRMKPVEIAKYYIRSGQDQSGLLESYISDEIGRGVFATKDFFVGDFLLEYRGKLFVSKAAKTLPDTNYTFHFDHQGNQYCIDATEEPCVLGSLGRLVNHGNLLRERNSVMKAITVDDEPHLCLFCTKNIFIGEQILYDYGPKDLPWLNRSQLGSHVGPTPTIATQGSAHASSHSSIEANTDVKEEPPQKRRKRMKPQETAKIYIETKKDRNIFEGKFINDFIGKGVYSLEDVEQGEFILEYRGSLIKGANAKLVEDTNYTFHFKHKGLNYCIDATEETSDLGRLVNHADNSSHRNCVMKIIEDDSMPHLCLISTRRIRKGEELRYDYGIKTLPWKQTGPSSTTDPVAPTQRYETFIEVGQSCNAKESTDENYSASASVADVGEVPNKSLPSNNRIENDLHDDNDGTLSVTKVASIHGSETFKEGRRSCDANTTNENYPAPASVAAEVEQPPNKSLSGESEIGNELHGHNDGNVPVTNEAYTDASETFTEMRQSYDAKDDSIDEIYPAPASDQTDLQHGSELIPISLDCDKDETFTARKVPSPEVVHNSTQSQTDKSPCKTPTFAEVVRMQMSPKTMTSQNDNTDTNKVISVDRNTMKWVRNPQNETKRDGSVNRSHDIPPGWKHIDRQNSSLPVKSFKDRYRGRVNKSLAGESGIGNELHGHNDGTVSVTNEAYTNASATFIEMRQNCDAKDDSTNKVYSAPASDAGHLPNTSLAIVNLIENDLQVENDGNFPVSKKPATHVTVDELCKETRQSCDATDDSIDNIYSDPASDAANHTDEDGFDDSADETYYPSASDSGSSYSDDGGDEEKCDDNEIQQKKGSGHGNVNRNNKSNNVALKIQMEKVTIPTYSQKENGKRDYRKVNYCLFCKRSFTSKISDHYTNIHLSQDKVKEARMQPKGSAGRKKLLLELENRGNFQHNVKVIENGCGELVVARRPNAKSEGKYTADNFLPCEYCLGFYLKDSLWLHMSSCCLRPLNKQPSTNYVRDAQVLLSPYVKEMTDDDKTLEALFTGMKETVANPGLPEICKTDQLIREFAKSLLCRLGPSDDQRIKDLDNIRTKVRTVGRLLSQLNENRTEALPLEKFISGTHFTYVVNATKALALKTNSPQIALVLGHYMKHSALLKISLGIQNAFVEMQNEGRDFQILYQAHWNNQVSCVAKRRQRLRTLNKPAEIPVTDDLVTLKNWLQKELTECLTVQTPDKETWKRIAQMALVRIALFNKRRISEVQDIRVSDFLDADSNDEIDGEIFNSLDMPEKILSKRMKVMEVRGKSTRGLRKVFVLLAPDMADALEYLMRTRCSSSPFLFCRKSNKTPLDGCEAMRVVTATCPGLRYPDRIRTRKLRKYLATTSQIIDMTDSELKMVADHMGHNMNVHTDVYRLQSSLLEKTKVARVLIAMENGHINRFAGKRLEAISVDDIPEPVSHNDDWAAPDPTNTDQADEALDVHEIPEPTNEAIVTATDSPATSHNAAGIDHTQDAVEDSADDGDEHEEERKTLKRKKDLQAGEKIKRVRWSDDENKIFRELMQPYICSKTLPPGHAIRQLATRLNARTPAQIRTKMHNIITGKLKTF